MQRGDIAVFSISTALAAVVVAAVAFSELVLDRTPSSAVIASGDSDSSWLVVTWGPSLCKIDPSNLGCTSGHVGKMGQTFVLHGLWPQPFENQFCGVPKEVADRARKLRGSDMPSVELSEDVRERLQSKLSDAGVMAPHEWYTHGTCSGVTPDVYFSDAATLTDQARKILDPMFQQAKGSPVSIKTVRDEFNAEFGEGAGDRLGLSCRNVTGEGSVAYEVHLSLPPVEHLSGTGSALSLGDLLLKAPTISAGCRHGYVP
ncbi:MAG: ribonuclease [Mycobacterium sp.]|nr:ribonuclease [Mycobacterium sp.]